MKNNANNNNLKDGQNDILEKKEILIRTRNWSGLYAFEEYKRYTKQLKPTTGKKNKKNGIYNTYHEPQSQQWID